MDLQDEHGLTPLMTGIGADYPLVISQLLRASADPNIVASNTFTPLHLAAHRGNNGVVNMLLSAGANPNVQTIPTFDSPLSIAVFNGQEDIVETLLLGTVYVDPRTFAKSESNPLPLLKCMELHNYSIAKILIIAGYSAVPEVNTGVKSVLATNETADCESWLFLKHHASTALPLQHQCRLHIRRTLQRDISNKVQGLNLPQVLKDFITYRNCYTPLNLKSDKEIYDYFEENMGDIH